MADARSLLRAQRAARRIEHPHAQYTDSGKLTCTVCREAIKSEGLWENHTRSASHRQKLLAHQKARARPAPASTNGVAQKPKSSTDTLSDEALLAQIIGSGGAGQKRKHEDDSDVVMADAEAGERDEDEGSDGVRKKRSKQDMGSSTVNTTLPAPTGISNPPSSTAARNGSPIKTDSPASTPPGLVRRSSGTPSHGVELQIPSRPATPSASAASSTSTPKATPIGKSPLISHEAQMGAPNTVPTKQGPKANFVTSVTSTSTETPPSIDSLIATMNTTEAKLTINGEDDDWAAFEAEVVNAAPPSTTAPPDSINTSSDAFISAAPLTAEQIAAKSEEEDSVKRRTAADVELEDEQEEAKRALEAEFEEMEELEARVRKLKEKREAIRRGSVPATSLPTEALAHAATVNGAQGADVGDNSKEEEDDDSDDGDEDEDDDWAGFRFRG